VLLRRRGERHHPGFQCTSMHCGWLKLRVRLLTYGGVEASLRSDNNSSLNDRPGFCWAGKGEWAGTLVCWPIRHQARPSRTYRIVVTMWIACDPLEALKGFLLAWVLLNHYGLPLGFTSGNRCVGFLHADSFHPHFACRHCRLSASFVCCPHCSKQLCVPRAHTGSQSPHRGQPQRPRSTGGLGTFAVASLAHWPHAGLSYAWLSGKQASGDTVSYSAGAMHSAQQLRASCGAAEEQGLREKQGLGIGAGCQRLPRPITGNLQSQLRLPGLPGAPGVLRRCNRPGHSIQTQAAVGARLWQLRHSHLLADIRTNALTPPLLPLLLLLLSPCRQWLAPLCRSMVKCSR
jgi:hypothetical protein